MWCFGQEEYMFVLLIQPRLLVECVRGRVDAERNVLSFDMMSFLFFLTTTTTI